MYCRTGMMENRNKASRIRAIALLFTANTVLGSILQNIVILAEKFTDKFSPTNCGQFSTQKQQMKIYPCIMEQTSLISRCLMLSQTYM
jgi:hypothetical protein